MLKLTKEQIYDLAQELDIGNRCFIHKKTGEFMFLPDFEESGYDGEEFFEEEIEKLENNFTDYIEIDRPRSHDSFQFMADFTEQLQDRNPLKNRLINALNKRKPFREFKFLIDNSGAYRQAWFDFKNAQLCQWVMDKFEEKTRLMS